MKWGSEQHLFPPFHREKLEKVEKLEQVPCSRRLDFADRRGTSEHLAPPEVALAAGGGSVEASGLQNSRKSLKITKIIKKTQNTCLFFS